MVIKRKLNIAVLMGGQTAEHEISIRSGQMVLSALSPQKYRTKAVIIQKNGLWVMPAGFGKRQSSPTRIYRSGAALDKLVQDKIDVIFLAMHGTYGEDGTIQGMLEIAGIPYTGSNVLSSSLAMHKIKSLEIYEYHGLLTPKRIEFNRWDWEKYPDKIIYKIQKKLGLPCIIKPVQLGSSVAISIARSKNNLQSGIRKVIQHDTEVMAEEYICGDELTCAVLGGYPGEKPRALPPTLIKPKSSKFFDYNAKYTAGASDEITPAPIGKKLTKKVQQIAVKAHQILHCGSMSRTDMILRNGKIYLLETNTIPGMTEVSLYPQAAVAAGMKLSDLVDRIIELALVYHQNRQKIG